MGCWAANLVAERRLAGLPSRFEGDGQQVWSWKDLPYIFDLEWSVNSRLQDLVQQFKEKLQLFWSTLEKIDKSLYVVSPKLPSLASTYRQIGLGNDCYLLLHIDPRNPTYLPWYRLLGPDSATETISKKWKRNGRKWSNERSFMENLAIVLENNLLGPPKECKKGEEQIDCGICYAHYLPHDDELGGNSGNSPDYKCDNCCCSRVFHTVCLRDWLRSITTTRQSFDVLFGNCPYCSDPVAVKSSGS
ncbi:E3 ubiquitin-protein ligase FANCL [Phalaenopsis equestris]|uniref:E3 ubiquitin-protein ligase FANCL n=1 Tax=Phalaenopsis equestris TaxID=78828 RepID=UPI0009E275D0|nr:E3 ubiquitin-protein ligase FANCL [Phalaenopsis equestris]